MKVLITGGAGYIGSTISSSLLDRGHTPVVLDSLVNGKKEFATDRVFYRGDIADRQLLARIVADHPDIECVVHCAALIVVPESVANPSAYYRENVAKSLELFDALRDLGMRKFVFSSSASIYEPTESFKVDESGGLNANCPYAFSKIVVERMLEDFCRAYDINALSLRYFNPIGADPKMRSGPYVQHPSHLLGILVDVASGRRTHLDITGVDWATRDGTGIRDYVHVWDLAEAHALAVEKMDEVLAKENRNYSVINLGSERGTTVREFVSAFERVVGRAVSTRDVEPRPGDTIGAFADSSKAKRLLGWAPQKTVEDGIRDAIRWDKKRKTILGY